MSEQYSIAEARNRFAKLIHKVEDSADPIRITRHGQVVAYVIGREQFTSLTDRQQHPDFFTLYMQWRDKWQVDNEKDDDDDPFADVRDRTLAEDNDPWR